MPTHTESNKASVNAVSSADLQLLSQGGRGALVLLLQLVELLFEGRGDLHDLASQLQDQLRLLQG